jgi:hypothetical protein
MKKCLHAGTAALLVLGASGFVHLPARRHFQPVATARSARRAAAKSTFAPRGSTTRLFSAAADKAALKEGGEGEEEGEEEDEPATEEDCSPIFEDACLVEEDAALMSKRAKMKKLLGTKPVQLTMYLFLWYFFNAGFNVSNKQVLNKFPHPWIVAWFQLATGLLWVLPSWKTGIRQAPIVDRKLLLLFLPIALLHSSGHAAQVASMGLGTVFFTHVIKAAEPLVGTLVVLFATGKIAPWYVNICLAPVVGGVAYAAGKPGMRFDVSDLWSLPSILALLSTVSNRSRLPFFRLLPPPTPRAELDSLARSLTHSLDNATNLSLTLPSLPPSMFVCLFVFLFVFSKGRIRHREAPREESDEPRYEEGATTGRREQLRATDVLLVGGAVSAIPPARRQELPPDLQRHGRGQARL